MKFIKTLLASAALASAVLAATATSAGAATLVDTGPGITGYGWTLGFGYSWAGEFTLNKAADVTDLQAFMYNYDGTMVTQVYKANKGLPGTSKALFSEGYPVTYNPSAGWAGPSNLSLSLGAGTYWVTFLSTGFDGRIPEYPANPLADYAQNLNGVWTDASYATFGVRVLGASVPEPGIWAMMLIGLGGLGAAMRSRRRLSPA